MTGLFFRYIPPGTFTMGSPSDEPERMADEVPHQVTISRGFWLSDAEVTQEQWSTVMYTYPSRASDCGRECPVESVTWRDAIEFLNAASRLAGLPECYQIDGDEVSFVGLDCDGLRLPTEAEWEYAARAGTSTPFWSGETLGPEHANFDSRVPFAGAAPGVFPGQVMPVRSYLPNPWGLYDVHGNVSEFVWDAYATYPSTSVVDPVGSGQGAVKVFRGGGWTEPASKCRSAVRGQGSPKYSYGDLGLRVARTRH
jgi:formylglycine-generating enzyme required for sulfatase activity